MNSKYRECAYQALTDLYNSSVPSNVTTHEFSDGFERKIKRIIKEQHTPVYKLFNTAGRMAACIAVLIILTSSVSVMSVKALREKFFGFFVEIFDKYSIVQSIEKSDASELSEYSIKTDFELIEHKENEIYIHSIYKNGDDYIYFYQYTEGTYDALMNTQNPQQVYIDGSKPCITKKTVIIILFGMNTG